jgi:Carbohydrate binding domain (family 11)
VAGSCTTSGGGGASGAGGAGGFGGTRGSGGVIGSGGIVGSGGRTGSGGIIGTGGVTTTSTGGCGALIDNMEADTGKICQGNGRVGLWFTYVDSATTSAIAPVTTGPAYPDVISSPRGTSNYAMHMHGTYSTYAGMACWLNKSTFSGTTGTYNASTYGYTGITFWAKGSGGTLNIVGQMASTESTTYGGTCTASTCSGNYYVYPSTLSSTTWTQISIPFTYLTGGTVTPFSPSGIWSLEFQYYSSASMAGATFDLWIDDLSFY